MNHPLVVRAQSPEELELASKQAELAALETKLADHELRLATLQARLARFERKYLRIVGVLYAELDAIKACIADARLRESPEDEIAKKSAADARARAEESAQATGAMNDQEPTNDFRPSPSLKNLFREAAKAMHPDLATDEQERQHRNEAMAQANAAYHQGDETKLREILAQWQVSAESIKGDGPGAELVRIIRKIAQVKLRLHAIRDQWFALKASDLYKLRREALSAKKKGRDMFAEMSARLRLEVERATSQLGDAGV